MSRAAMIVAAVAVLIGGIYFMTPRGIRNNNPGNIRKTSTSWLGEVTGVDLAFETFDTPADGIRAMAIVLRNKQRLHGFSTLRQIIGDPQWGYAPPSENDVSAYVADVAGRMGVSPDTRLNLEDQATLAALVQAVIWHEQGQQPYPVATIEASVRAA